MTNHSLMTGVSRVETKENNITAAPVPVSTSTGAIVVYSEKGEINKPILITRGRTEILQKFGNPHPSLGYGLYGALQFVDSSSALYVVRAVSGNYSYGSAVYGENFSSGTYQSSSFAAPVYTNATIPDESVTWNIGSPLTRQNAFLIRRIGPGTEGNNIAVSISSDNMPNTSTPLTAVVGTESGALLSPGQYRWKAVPVNKLGRALDSIQPNTTALTVAAPNNIATVSFPRISGAVSYEIYRQAVGSANYFYHTTVQQVAVGLSTVSFVDRGQFIADTTRVLPSSPANNYVPTPVFRLNIFDIRTSLQNPIEFFDVTFNQGVDGFGQQQGIEEKVNLLSQEVRVQRNDMYVPAVSSAGNPIFYSSPSPYTFTLGANGLSASSIPDSAYINAYNLFNNEDEYPVRIIIEAGKTQSVQNAIIDLCAQRKDCFPFLDVPPDFQSATNAVNYRTNILNKNTDRAALYTPDLQIYDEYNSLRVWVPPSAHAAAIFARNDSNYAIYTAGAGLLYSQFNDVETVRYKYNKAELNLLADAQVNPVRAQSGAGIYLPEQLTLTRQLSALSFISVRRMIDAIELSVSRASEYYLQQPNNDDLARQLTNLIDSFLEPLVPNGLSNYEIVSDTTNNTPAYTNNAQRNVTVYIWPVLPARYIQLVMNITKAGVSFQELIPNQ